MGYTVTALLAALTALFWLLRVALTPGSDAFSPMIATASYFLTALTGARVAEALLVELMGGGQRSEVGDLSRVVMSIVLYGAALLLWMRFGLGFDITNLLATSAVISLVLGLALQATLGNMFAGLWLEIERPFHVGDYIRSGDVEGRVGALKWRSVFLETPNDTTIVLPNSTLTSQSIEVVRRDRPSKMEVKFYVPASVPPISVLTLAKDAMRNPPSEVATDPAPTVLFLGSDQSAQVLGYAAHFHSFASIDRNSVCSRVSTRLWYALSREGVRMHPKGIGEAKDQSTATAVAAPPSSLDAALASIALRLQFGPQEVVPANCAGFVVQGSARESLTTEELDVDASVAKLLEPAPSPDAPLLLPDELLASISAQAARFVGPIAHAIVDRCARLTDDPFLLYRVLARSIGEAGDRATFLESAPTRPTRRLVPGAPFGWAGLLGLDKSRPRDRTVDWTAELLVVARSDLKELLDATEADSLAARIASEPDLKPFDRRALAERLRATANPTVAAGSRAKVTEDRLAVPSWL